MVFESFCGHSLWDPEISYNSNRPIFSPCLTETVTLWFCSSFLWIGSPLAVYGALKASKPRLPYTKRLIIRLTASIALCVLTLYELISVIIRSSNGSDIYPYQKVSSVVRLISFFMATVLLVVYQRKGIHSSGLLFAYWLLMALTMSINYWTLIDANNNKKLKRWNFDAEDFTIRTIQLSLIWILLIFNCFVDTRKTLNSIDKQTIQIESPYESASFLSYLLFTWYDSMALLGFKRTLTSSDIWPLPSEYKSKPIDCAFNHLLTAGTKYNVTESSKASKANGGQFEKLDLKATKTMKLSLLGILLKGFWPYFVLSGLFKLVSSVLIFANPLFMDYLLTFVKATDKPAWHGIFIALGMFVITFISSMFEAHYEFLIQTTSMKIKTALTASVYQKTLRLSSAARQSYTTGEIINLMAVDLDRIVEYVNIMNYLWSPPIQLIIALFFLWRQLGVASIAGLAVLVILIPCNGYVAHRLELLEDKILSEKDKRSKLMSEILNGMKVLKLYAWEGAFGDRAAAIRAKELKYQRSDAYWETGIYFTFDCLPFMMNLVNFATFALLSSSNILDANRAFVSIALINILQDPLAFLPMVIAYGVNFTTSLRRINEFLQCDELDPKTIDHEPAHETPIKVENATFCWSHDDEPIIKKLSLAIKRNKLVAIVGTIGSGKSSVLSALLGELYKKEGYVNVHGRIAFVPQSAWIQNATVRDNILFGEPYDKEKYENVIEACALASDLKILPGNDQTEIGERGINVSGGQKQRISIARAVYSDTDIYLLDDPLSAVDSHVAAHLFDRVIGPNGLLRNKTRLFVTHRLAFLPQVDEIIVLKDGKIYDQGSFDELMDKKGSFAEFIDQFMSEIEEDDDEVIEKESSLIEKTADGKIARMGSIRSVESESKLIRTLSSFKRPSTISHIPKKEIVSKKEPEESKFKLIENEEAEQGSIKTKVYLDYFSAIGWLPVLGTIAFYLCVSVLDFGTNLWLSAWADDASIPGSSNNTALRNKRLGVYAALGFGNAISVLASVTICNLAMLKGATLIHNQMLNRVIRAPMSFFDTTPAGRIMNRFTRDIDIADNVIGHEFQLFLSQFFRLIVAIIGIVTGSVYLLIVLFVLGFVYIFIQKIYIASSRQLRRITSITESPIYSHFSETINGASSIRAFNSSDRFIEECYSRIDTSNRSFFLSIGASRWLSIRLEFLGNIVVTLAVILVLSTRDSLSAGEAGLSISYSFEITTLLSYLIMSISNIETNIVSIERCLEFTRTETEAAWVNENKRPTQKWPDRGEIIFRDYSTRYRPGLDLVLKNIGFTIHPREKVGIVGRTGAGKSSLTLALFRLIEPANGMIIIDDQDVTQFGLHDLRSRLTVIPQDPVLFSASFRSNFDPFQKHSDEEIWTALEHANLKQFVDNLENGLDYEISEGGENLSVGQRQLVCLTRALLRKTKILVLDEATAAVDVETDELIQETIRREFADSTIVTIAHRLNTIMDYDKIMVMDKGNIIEYDSPSNLLANEDTEFYSMAKEAKIV